MHKILGHSRIPKVPTKTLTHRFDYYPPCIVNVISTDIGCPNPFTYEELQILRRWWFQCIEPLLRHMENPEHVSTLLSAFEGAPKQLPPRPGQSAGDYLWQFIEQIADLFPALVFTQIEKTIADTEGRDPRREVRTKWIRKEILKDLRKSEVRLREMRAKVGEGILACEKNEQDQRLLVLEHILSCVLQEVHGKSIRTLIKGLTGGVGILS